MNAITGRFVPTAVTTQLASLVKTSAAPTLSSDSVTLSASPEKPKEGKSVGQSLVSAAKWGAVGGVLSAIPFFGYLVSAVGGAVAGELIAGKNNHKLTPMIMGATAGLATHVIPMSGFHVHAFGMYHAFLPATILFGAATWGYAAYHQARGNA